MHYYLLTGASRGLGRALAEALLRADDTTVVGVSRHAAIEHPRYWHQPLDLSDLAAVEHNLPKVFRPFADATSLTLINNAAVLGEIGYLGQLPNDKLEWVFGVNVVAPALLLNTFLATYVARQLPLTVLNISSGAAQRPVDGWAAYCASKAALEMLTRTVAREQTLLGNQHVRIHALSPGVLDTVMQEQIRAADPAAFSEAARFRAYHQMGELRAPEEAAQLLAAWLRQPPPADSEVVLHLRDLPTA